MKKIVEMKFGSQVYGTALPSSDQDFKGIFIPSAEDLILQKAPHTQSFHSNTAKNTKNTKDDIDLELFSVQKFMMLLWQGQTLAFDVLFTPKQFWLEITPEWEYILANREKLLHKKISAFVGYCKAQSERYSMRGSRMIALEQIIGHLSKYKYNDTVEEAMKDFKAFGEHTKIETQAAPGLAEGELKFLSVCGKKAGYTSSVKYAFDIYKSTLHGYGERARAAASQQGIDLKAQYHAVRIASEAEELLTTGFITFPRPEAPLLLQIRKGELAPEYVSKVIEEGMTRIEEAQKKSILPIEPDKKFMDQFVMDSHLEAIKELIGKDEENIRDAFFFATKKIGW